MRTASNPVIVIGASHAAVQLGVSLRQEGYRGDIVLIGQEKHPPYNRPPLSKTLLTQQVDFERTMLRQMNFYETQGIALRLGTTVTGILPDHHEIELDSGERLAFSKLVIATGASPIQLNLPGIDLKGIGYLRNLDNAASFAPFIQPGNKAVVVGGGYIGLEAAAALNQAELSVTVLEGMDRVLQRVTAPQVSEFFRLAHERRGVSIVTGAQATAFAGQEQVNAVTCLNNTNPFEADMVIIGVGVQPNTEIASNAGLSVSNGIVVDCYCQTEDSDIFAIGDCTNFPRAGTDQRIRLESVPNAVAQAKSAAAAICGRELPHNSLPWFWSDQYGLKLQIAGINTGYDDVVIRGKMEDEHFSAWYFQGEQLLAVDAVNAMKDFIQAKKLLSEGLTIRKEEVTDH